MAKKNEGRTDETIIAELQDAVKAHHEGTNMDAHIKALRGELQAVLTEGAQPCPLCGQKPHGMEQPTAKGVEYEIGCLGCKPFKHKDGTTRRPAVRGGLLPKHAVEAWNAGPDFWLKV